uniref:Uncharacterized protein n=1 Tax=Leptocylindrus danicus TaxID=163516 RepID=A0A7S2KFF4_9STRA|mmetsp:Transcript_22252/g.33411  ORF Transcript_22252/g.33411 Transcript_22252/m.33411 type:complete len:116 (+) Transcript_22252:97-444(+)
MMSPPSLHAISNRRVILHNDTTIHKIFFISSLLKQAGSAGRLTFFSFYLAEDAVIEEHNPPHMRDYRAFFLQQLNSVLPLPPVCLMTFYCCLTTSSCFYLFLNYLMMMACLCSFL